MASADFTEKEDLEEIMKIQEVRVSVPFALDPKISESENDRCCHSLRLAFDVFPPSGDDSSSQPEPEGREEN